MCFGNRGCMVGFVRYCLEMEGEVNALGYAEIILHFVVF